jgi:hypothetical protein
MDERPLLGATLPFPRGCRTTAIRPFREIPARISSVRFSPLMPPSRCELLLVRWLSAFWKNFPDGRLAIAHHGPTVSAGGPGGASGQGRSGPALGATPCRRVLARAHAERPRAPSPPGPACSGLRGMVDGRPGSLPASGATAPDGFARGLSAMRVRVLGWPRRGPHGGCPARLPAQPMRAVFAPRADLVLTRRDFALAMLS